MHFLNVNMSNLSKCYINQCAFRIWFICFYMIVYRRSFKIDILIFQSIFHRNFSPHSLRWSTCMSSHCIGILQISSQSWSFRRSPRNFIINGFLCYKSSTIFMVFRYFSVKIWIVTIFGHKSFKKKLPKIF